MNAAKTCRNLPPLAGLSPLSNAIKPGLSVEECVRRLKRYRYAFKRLHEIFTPHHCRADLRTQDGLSIISSSNKVRRYQEY